MVKGSLADLGSVVDWVTALATMLAVWVALYVSNRDRRDRTLEQREERAANARAMALNTFPLLVRIRAKLEGYPAVTKQAAEAGELPEHDFLRLCTFPEAEQLATLLLGSGALEREMADHMTQLVSWVRELNAFAVLKVSRHQLAPGTEPMIYTEELLGADLDRLHERCAELANASWDLMRAYLRKEGVLVD